MKQICHFLIGAASSGGGKTTFTTGLLRLFRNRGLKVQPYKCGPDYIDTKYHEMAAGNASVNLDLWLSTQMHVKEMYAKYASGMDVCVTEGVMGLFDGFDGMEGSSAAIAALLDIPVVLVVNAKSTSYTVAPIIYGFKHFNPSVRLAGVVFNQVASERHFSFLQKACEDVGVECFGFLPRLKELEVPSRHLGLTLDTSYQFDKFASVVAQAIEDHVAVDRILEVCCVPSIGQGTTGLNTTEQVSYAKVLGATSRKDGYLEGNDYLVSWCVGHLVELAPPNVYDAKYVKWSIADLPILPEKWQYLVSASTKKQFGILQKLMHRSDVDTVVNSCDAG